MHHIDEIEMLYLEMDDLIIALHEGLKTYEGYNILDRLSQIRYRLEELEK